jgi:hypothetical protein
MLALNRIKLQGKRFWPALLVAAYGGVYLTASAWAIQNGRHFTICLLKNLTGLPCPFCGGTRAASTLLQGHLAAAFALNPGAVLLMLFALPGYLVYDKLLRPRGWEKKLSRVFWVLALLALAANWTYLIIVGR